MFSLMFSLISLISNLISCRDYILRGKKGKVVYPSQLDISFSSGLQNKKPKKPEGKKFKLLYVGRIRIEKGIFSLVNLIKNKRDISLTIVGAEKNTSYKINQSNVVIQLTQSNKARLIKYYDDPLSHNVFILPSYTEGLMNKLSITMLFSIDALVLLEALARRRPE